MRMRGDMAMREHLGVQSIGRCQAPDVLRRLLARRHTVCTQAVIWGIERLAIEHHGRASGSSAGEDLSSRAHIRSRNDAEEVDARGPRKPTAAKRLQNKSPAAIVLPHELSIAMHAPNRVERRVRTGSRRAQRSNSLRLSLHVCPTPRAATSCSSNLRTRIEAFPAGAATTPAANGTAPADAHAGVAFWSASRPACRAACPESAGVPTDVAGQHPARLLFGREAMGRSWEGQESCLLDRSSSI